MLYFWRSHPGSVSLDIDSKTYAVEAGYNLVKDNLKKAGLNASVSSSRAFPTIYRIKYELTSLPLISIIIPNKDHYSDLKKCLDSIHTKTTYSNYEIIVVDNNSTDAQTLRYVTEMGKNGIIKLLHWNDTFNFAAINNYAVQNSNGEFVVLLNNDTEVISPEWLEEMLMYAQRKDVGAVGAKLYYTDNTIQHAGIILGFGKDRVAGHSHHMFSRASVGYMGKLCYAQNVSAVTAACMMIRTECYKEVDGMDEEFKISYNDVDLCMKIRQKGYLIVFTPYAELYHYESKSRGYEDTRGKIVRLELEALRFRTKWENEIEAGDPYYNPNLTLERSDYSMKNKMEICNG